MYFDTTATCVYFVYIFSDIDKLFWLPFLSLIIQDSLRRTLTLPKTHTDLFPYVKHLFRLLKIRYTMLLPRIRITHISLAFQLYGGGFQELLLSSADARLEVKSLSVFLTLVIFIYYNTLFHSYPISFIQKKITIVTLTL